MKDGISAEESGGGAPMMERPKTVADPMASNVGLGLPEREGGGRVRLLDPQSVNQIAAGEVVERPASALKELIENAIDAGATRIQVDLEQAGRLLIRVGDNGEGMTAEDAGMALLRHATSKIRSSDDLHRVTSLGFRGEALPSIGSVSRMTLKTADADGLRTVLEVSGGEIMSQPAEAGPRGTVVEVRDLFYNTPARLKFLKSDNTELGACLDAAGRLAISRPDIAFVMRHGPREAFRTAGSGDLFEAVAAFWNRDFASGMAPVDADVAGVRLKGYVSPPYLTKPTRAYQFLYVNGRSVRSRSLTIALDQAYRDLTPERRFPAVVLMLELDPSLLDMNVSPTKSEVKFQREGAVFEALRTAIRGALLEHGMIPSAKAAAVVNEALSSIAAAQRGAPMILVDPGLKFGHREDSSWIERAEAFDQIAPAALPPGSVESGRSGELSVTDPAGDSVRGEDGFASGESGSLETVPTGAAGSGAAGSLPTGDASAFGASAAGTGQGTETDSGTGIGLGAGTEPGTGPRIGPGIGPGLATAASGQSQEFQRHAEGRRPFAELIDGLQVIGQAMNTFIIAETRKGLVIIDQHVAHERILYEHLYRTGGRGALETQPLLTPLVLHLDRRTFVLASERLDDIRRAGFLVEPFGRGDEVGVFETDPAGQGRQPSGSASASASGSASHGPVLHGPVLHGSVSHGADWHGAGSAASAGAASVEPAFLVRAVPAVIRGRNPLKVLRTIVEELAEGAAARRISPTCEQVWAMASCKMAVKAGDPLSIAEMTKLVLDLAETENPYLCPHGRPITVTLDSHALLKLFKRA